MKDYKHLKVWIFLIIGLFLLVLVGALRLGSSGRIMSTAVVTAAVESPAQAAALWEKSGVRGRTLLLFDVYPHMRGLAFYEGAPALTDANFIEYSIFRNILRRIHIVVADDQWQEFVARKDIGVFRAVGTEREGLYLFTMSGVPLIAVPASALPFIQEKVLVFVNSRRFPDDQIRSLLKSRKIQYDIYLTCDGGRQ